MTTASEGLIAREIRVDFGETRALDAIDLVIPPASMVALAGPNGSGKTTLLRVLAGLLRPASGVVSLDGQALGAISGRLRARRIAVVAQRVDANLLFTARNVVALGRSPHTGFLGSLSAGDRRAVERSLTDTEVDHLAGKKVKDLSGGEQQRVFLAAALAQETDYLLLDEPTAHLDLHHQQSFLALLSRLHRRRNVSVLAAIHDLNLAALYFQRLVVLDRGRRLLDGPAADIMCDPALGSIFGTPLSVVTHPVAGVPQLLLEPD